MKTVKLEVFTGKTQFTKEVKLHSQTGLNKIVGTCINSLFEYNSRLRKYGATHIKANELLSVNISSNGETLLDSYELNSNYGFKLKFGNTGKSKRNFASCLHDLMTWAATDDKVMTLDDLIESLK